MIIFSHFQKFRNSNIAEVHNSVGTSPKFKVSESSLREKQILVWSWFGAHVSTLGPRFYMLDTPMLEALCNLPDLEELHAYYLQDPAELGSHWRCVCKSVVFAQNLGRGEMTS